MVTVNLHGIFEDFIKTEWTLEVESIGEMFEAIEANSGKLIKTLGILDEYSSYFLIYVDDKIVSKEYYHSPLLKKNSKVQVVPLILGSELTAIILLIVSIGLQFLITKLLTPKSPTDAKTSSFLFSGFENVAKRNTAIPIGYGRMKIGSVVVSNSTDILIVKPLTLTDTYQVGSGSGGRGSPVDNSLH
jgi:predicted phage tail protein